MICDIDSLKEVSKIHANKNIKYFFDNADGYTDEDLKWHADKLANEFYTILKTAIEWEKKVLKTK